jgi:hypothetical protein
MYGLKRAPIQQINFESINNCNVEWSLHFNSGINLFDLKIFRRGDVLQPRNTVRGSRFVFEFFDIAAVPRNQNIHIDLQIRIMIAYFWQTQLS